MGEQGIERQAADRMEQLDAQQRLIDRDVCRAVSAAEDGTLQEADRKRLNATLSKDRRARKVYLDFIALRVLLQSIAGRAVRREAEDRAIELAYKLSSDSGHEPAGANKLTVSDVRTNEQPHPRPVGSQGIWRLRRYAPAFAAAATLAVAVVGYRFVGGGVAPPVEAEPDGRMSAVATVNEISRGAVWSDPNESLSIGATLGEGQRVRLSGGEIELIYQSGVRVSVIGPADLRLKEEGLMLAGGGLLASVPEAGHGFTVETPNGKVVDLGTEFGVVVDDFGYSEVGVFKGKVEAYPLASSTRPQGAPSVLELTEGDGLLWTERTVERTRADARRFTAARLSLERRGSRAGVGDTISTEYATESVWRVRGEGRATESGYTLDGKLPSTRPYLVSTREYDPTDGPIVVECDVVLRRDSATPSVAILTRSDEQRGVAGPPWTDVLATCVRCSFGTSPETGVGVLKAATKHEGGWEPIALSWQGFRKPMAGVRYRLAMIDDGVNVAFTVTLADDPSVQKTVCCRSLFRGKSNYVAIEGPWDGSADFERIRVYQQESPSPREGNADSAALFASENGARSAAANSLERLFPEDAELRLSETFDNARLDGSKWEVLGDVRVRGGAAQLGAQVADATIDTWRARPYLVTQEAYSLAGGPLTLVGRIVFDENYLTGFGGSFAAVTRAGLAYRGGEGWERSLLDRGFRANFWPSGLELEHSLELHRMAKRGAVRLVAHSAYEIDPRSRTYNFRVRDNGAIVELLVIDAADPERRANVNWTRDRATDAGPVLEGHIGFEATWGSPVSLEEVYIFQAASVSKASGSTGH